MRINPLLLSLLVLVSGPLPSLPRLHANNLVQEAALTDDKGWSAVHRAAAEGDLGKLRAFAAAGADLDAPHPDNGERPQHRAARFDKFDALRFLVGSGKIDVGVGDNNGATVLYWVARARDLDLTRWLVGRGAPVHVQRGWHPLLGAAIGGSPELVQYYLDLGFPPDLPDHNNHTALTLAATFGQVAALKSLLAQAPSATDQQSSLVFALRAALDAENPAAITGVAKPLLESAKSRLSDQQLQGLLHLTLLHAYMKAVPDEVVDLLEKHGAHPNSLSDTNFPLLHNLLYQSEQRPEVIGRVLKRGAKPNVKDPKGRTALHVFITREPNAAAFKLLLEAGADPHALDESGRNLLHQAVNAPITIFRQLIDLGVDVNGADQNGETPLMVAASSARNVAVLRDLLAAGASPLAKNKDGKTALQLVDRYGGDFHLIEARRQLLTTASGGKR
jgi:ankyrin repeat protein